MGYLNTTNVKKIRENIVENSQKGQLYRIQFANDDQIYEGIPISSSGMQGERGYFEFKVTAPESARGLRWCHYRDIEKMERRL